MADIIKTVTSAFETTKDTLINYHIVEAGASSLLTGIYDSQDDVTTGFYKAPDITGGGTTTKLAVVYGEVMITPYLIDAGVSSSTNDPASIVKTYRFVAGDGTNGGVVTGPNGSPLENVYIKDPNGVPQPVINSDGRPSMGTVVLASALGGLISSAPKIWDALTSSSSSTVGTVDPVTGKAIPGLDAQTAANLAKNISLGTLTDVKDSGKGTNTVLVYDPKQLAWVPQSINTLLAGPTGGTGTICGGAGGDGGDGGDGGGGTGGTGGTGGSGTGISSSGSFTTSTPGTTYTKLDAANMKLLNPIQYGYIDSLGTSVILGTMYRQEYAPKGYPDFTIIGTIVKTALSAILKTSQLTVTVNSTSCHAYVTSTTNTGWNSSQCTTTDTINIWFKYSGTQMNTLTPAIPDCGSCYVKAPDLRLRDVIAASTTNIAGGTISSITDSSISLPSIRAYYENFGTAADGTGTSTIRAYLNRFSVIDGGANLFKPPLFHYTPTAGNGTYSEYANVSGGAITSMPESGISSSGIYKTVTLPNSGAGSFGKMVYNGSIYVTVSTSMSTTSTNSTGYACYSTDGNNWKTSWIGDYTSNKAVMWNGTKFCAIGSVSATSTDGITWATNSLPSTGTTSYSASIGGETKAVTGWQDGTSNGSIFCIVGSRNGAGTGCATSTDGITWTSRTISATNVAWLNVLWAGSKFTATGIVISSGGQVSATSTDGITWSYSASGGVAGGGLSYGSGTWVSITNSARYSTDGITWSNSGSLPNLGIVPYYTGLAHDGFNFVAVGNTYGTGYTNSAYSSDGITWISGALTSNATNPPIALNKVIWDGNFFRATIRNLTSTSNVPSYTALSRDGITWQKWYYFDCPETNELIPNGFGYDYTTSTQYFGVPNQKKRLVFSSALTSLDSISLANGNLVLLKDQTDQTQNGVYERINSTTYDQIYELNSYENTQNGNWTHVTSGLTNTDTDWILNSSTKAVYQLTDPQVWQNVTTSTSCDITPGTGGGGFPGSPGSPGSPGGPGSAGSPGEPGDCVTIDTTAKVQPTISFNGTCAKQYGTQTTPPNFDAVDLVPLQLDTKITSQVCQVNYAIITGKAEFQLSGAVPAGVISTIGSQQLQFTGDASDIVTASALVQILPNEVSKGDISYSVTIDNSEGSSAGVGCSVLPNQTIIETSQSASACINIKSDVTSGTGKVTITFNGRTVDLTNGYVPYSTSVNQTAIDIASNIASNIAVKHALDPTNAAWLPAFTASASTNKITISAPSAGGADFNGVKLGSAVTGAFVFEDCGTTFLGGITATVNNFLKSSGLEQSKLGDVLMGVGGSVLGAVITNAILNNASQLQISIPTTNKVDIVFLYHGRIVAVPNEYDAVARTGHPTYAAFSGTWKQSWTQNPAWCLYDYITNQRYGLGNLLVLTTAQRTALLQDLFELGKYCDEIVLDINGANQPRFSLNTVITEGTRLQILQQLCSVFYGSYIFNNGGLRITYDHAASDINFLVTQANANSFEKVFSSGSNFTNKVRLSYVEPSNFYTTSIVVAEDTASIATYGERAVDLVAFGCTNASQAQRYAKWILDSEFKNKTIITYNGGVDHYNLLPGQIVEFHDSNEYRVHRGGRIISNTGTAVVLDGASEAVAGDYFSLTLGDGTVHRTTIASITGVNVVLTAAPAVAALSYATWVSMPAAFGHRLYKVIKIDEKANAQYNVTLQLFDNTKFA